MANIEPVLAALDRLNGHARAFGCGKKAIYAYKTFMAVYLAVAGDITARPVEVHATCNRCDGTGLFWNYDPAWKSPCRSCGTTGRVRLRFIETRHGSRVWHHPTMDGGWRVLEAAWRIQHSEYPDDKHVLVLCDGQRRDLVYESPGDWEPNRPGEKLDGETTAGLLNIVEDWVANTTAEPVVWPWCSDRHRAVEAIGSYSLYIGQSGTVCHFCQAPEIAIRLGCYGEMVQWSAPVCKTHHDEITSDRWPKEPPEAALTPAIKAWMSNPVRLEQRRHKAEAKARGWS